jgi:hypothetical protein
VAGLRKRQEEPRSGTDAKTPPVFLLVDAYGRPDGSHSSSRVRDSCTKPSAVVGSGSRRCTPGTSAADRSASATACAWIERVKRGAERPGRVWAVELSPEQRPGHSAPAEVTTKWSSSTSTSGGTSSCVRRYVSVRSALAAVSSAAATTWARCPFQACMAASGCMLLLE